MTSFQLSDALICLHKSSSSQPDTNSDCQPIAAMKRNLFNRDIAHDHFASSESPHLHQTLLSTRRARVKKKRITPTHRTICGRVSPNMRDDATKSSNKLFRSKQKFMNWVICALNFSKWSNCLRTVSSSGRKGWVT